MLKERIAGALGVGKSSIAEDLRDCPGSGQSKRKKSSTNPKGSGRPKGSTKKDKPLWHRPRIVTVAQVGPFKSFTRFTLIDGRTLIVRDTPVVVNSTDAEVKARKTKQASLATQVRRARKKNRNPVTKRIDPVSMFKALLPYSTYKGIDAAAFKRLEDNPRDADGKPISFEQARALAIADFVKAATGK